jgi:hypothetical protein
VSRALVLALLATGVSGCCLNDCPPPAVPLASSYYSPPSDGRELMRVVVPPFQDETGSPDQVEAVRIALMRALGKRQRFELIPVGEQELREFLSPDTFETGIIPRDVLLAAARRYRADGVLFGVLTQFRPYEPLIVGMSVELAAVGTGEVVWSSSGLYDASTKSVAQDVHNFHDTELARTTSLEGWRITMLSPSRFTDYACTRVAETLP